LLVQLPCDHDLASNFLWIDPHSSLRRDLQSFQLIRSLNEFPLFLFYPRWAFVFKKPSDGSSTQNLKAENECCRTPSLGSHPKIILKASSPQRTRKPSYRYRFEDAIGKVARMLAKEHDPIKLSFSTWDNCTSLRLGLWVSPEPPDRPALE
jgi:hypothetical protein